MPKCSECGFLAVWIPSPRQFEEASAFFRQQGRPEAMQNHEVAFQPNCFIQKYNLIREMNIQAGAVLERIFSFSDSVHKTITAERKCNGFVPWIQGFHPKEHWEMLINEQTLAMQRRHANHSLYAAIATAVFTAASVIVGSIIANNSARIGADATIKAAQMQIEAQKEIAKQLQPINVTVNVPRGKSEKIKEENK